MRSILTWLVDESEVKRKLNEDGVYPDSDPAFPADDEGRHAAEELVGNAGFEPTTSTL